MTFAVIGITDNREQYFTPEVLDIVRRGKVFSGGMRHHELMRPLLPENHEWIDVKAPLSEVFEAYNKYEELTSLHLERDEGSVVVFASGDPLFYGYATTLRREFPESEICVYPTFNSLQLLAHRLVLAYQNMKCVSVTGRPWKELDDALISGEQLIGVLTDKYKTPRLIAERMMEYGYNNYTMSIGECLGNKDMERITNYSLEDVPCETLQPNRIILHREEARPLPFGIPEADFHLLDGRVNMITKAPIRLLTLSALDLPRRHTLWDVGFCTGSISIEARLRFPHLGIESFEIRQEGEQLMAANSRRFGAPGINAHIGDFMTADLQSLPRPDAVFIGGHGGRLVEMVQRIRQHLLPGGCIVFNAVSDKSCELFHEAVGECEETHITLDSHNPITIMIWKQQ